MSEENWFTAKAILFHKPQTENQKQWYEERILLLKVKSEKEALKRAKKEAKEYAKNLDGTQFLEITDIWEINSLTDEIGDKAEIFSSKMISLLKPDDYLEQFYPTTPEDCEANGEKHAWYNSDGKKSKCYNCLVIRKGQLWKTENE